MQKGVMAKIDIGSIISDDGDVTVSPQLHPQERIVVQNTIKSLLNDPQAAAAKMEFSKEWVQLYDEFKEAPFPTEDQHPKAFKDLD